ncbi:hypothetical protein AAF712_011042 [Marasmius tenuissimus]|uniref:Uncharacterized protein n=1 Tax=Marasmius tenuissimus TaxID=585030 RepID=A0ABR2ZKC6_9AGAR
MKLVLSALLFSLALVATAAPQAAGLPSNPPKLGEQCGTFVGEVKCDTGLTCCWEIPDDGKCYVGNGPADCPPMKG